MVSSMTFTAATVARTHALHQHTAASVVTHNNNNNIVETMIRNNVGSSAVMVAHSAKEERKSPGFLSICKSLFAGGVAGGVSRTAVAPLERLKILQQVAGGTTKAYNGVYSG